MGKKKGRRMKGKKVGLVSLVGTQTAADLEMPNLPKAPKVREEGELDQYGRVKRQPREERETQSSRADEDSMWRRGGASVPTGGRRDERDTGRDGGWRGGGGRSRFDRDRDGGRRSRSPPQTDDMSSRRPRLKLQKRTLPVPEIKKSMTLGEAFGKRTISTKPKSNPFGNAKPVAVGMRNLKEKLEKTQKSSPFGNAKPIETQTTKKKSNPFGDAKPTQTRDSFASSSQKEEEKNVESTTSNKENQDDATISPVEPKLSIRAKSPPATTTTTTSVEEEEQKDDEDESEWQTTGGSKKTNKQSKKKNVGGERKRERRSKRREPRRPKTNSRWARDENEENQEQQQEERRQHKPRWKRDDSGESNVSEMRRRRRSRSPPVASNSRWKEEDRRVEERRQDSRSPPVVSNSRWKAEERRVEERDSRSPPSVANSRWAREERKKDEIDMNDYRREKNITPPVVSENSRWASLQRDEDENESTTRRRDEEEPPKPLNSRWNASSDGNETLTMSEEPKIQNSRWKDTTTTTTTTVSSSSSSSSLKTEKSEKELELDRRIAAIRARKSVKTDMFGRPIVEKKKEEKKKEEKKPAVSTVMMPPMKEEEEEKKIVFCTTAISKENLEAYESMEDKSKLEKKTNSLLREYNVVHDVKEALLCMKELECPAHYPQIVKVIVSRTLESFKAKDVELAQKLLLAMRESLIMDVVLAKELNEAAEFMDDIKMDCPKAPKIFQDLAGYLLKFDGLIDPKHIKAETWKCANLEAPKRDDVDVLRELFETSKTRGEELYDEVAKAVDCVIPIKVLSAVLLSISSSSSSSLLEKDEDNTDKFTPFADEQYGAMLMKCFDETSADVQKAAVFELQRFCSEMKFPKGLCEAVFMTAQDEEILESSAFFAWAEDKTKSDVPGRLQARKETLAWLKWLEEEGDDSDSDDE